MRREFDLEVYIDKHQRFRLVHPVNWRIVPLSEGEGSIAFLPPAEDNIEEAVTAFYIYTYSVDKDFDLDDIINLLISELEEDSVRVKEIGERQERELSGGQALTTALLLKLPDAEDRVLFTVVFTINGDIAYLLIGSSWEKTFLLVKPIYEKMLDSFSFF